MPDHVLPEIEDWDLADVQRNLCELDKCESIHIGEGQPRRPYPGIETLGRHAQFPALIFAGDLPGNERNRRTVGFGRSALDGEGRGEWATVRRDFGNGLGWIIFRGRCDWIICAR